MKCSLLTVVRTGAWSNSLRREPTSRTPFASPRRNTFAFVSRFSFSLSLLGTDLTSPSPTEFEEGTTTFFCKIFFAEQFDALRRNCGCSSQFIESLARCVKWESSGGRSKVDFLKTKGE